MSIRFFDKRFGCAANPCTSCEDKQARAELSPSGVGQDPRDRASFPINTHELGLARLTELALYFLFLFKTHMVFTTFVLESLLYLPPTLVN